MESCLWSWPWELEALWERKYKLLNPTVVKWKIKVWSTLVFTKNRYSCLMATLFQKVTSELFCLLESDIYFREVSSLQYPALCCQCVTLGVFHYREPSREKDKDDHVAKNNVHLLLFSGSLKCSINSTNKGKNADDPYFNRTWWQTTVFFGAPSRPEYAALSHLLALLTSNGII